MVAIQVFIDRRNSSAKHTDADIRAGPMPKTLATAGEVQFHAYVDHSIVTVLVENQTALTVWVHPSAANSTGLALFRNAAVAADVGSDGSGGRTGATTLTEMKVWRLNKVPTVMTTTHA